jgi:signal transduction histidine kinase
MIEDVLLFASNRGGVSKPELVPTEVGPIIGQMLMEYRPALEKAGIALELRVPPDLPSVKADSRALATCLRNLLENAMKHAAAGQWIAIHAETHPREIRLAVQDRGPGIPSGDRARIFHPFYRGALARKAQIPGSGLGLNLVRELMKQMGGRVTVRPNKPRGSIFVLHVPA